MYQGKETEFEKHCRPRSGIACSAAAVPLLQHEYLMFGVTMAYPKISAAHATHCVQVMANRMYRNPLGILLSDYRIRIQFVEEKGVMLRMLK